MTATASRPNEKTNYFIAQTLEEVFADGKKQHQRKRIIGDFVHQGVNTLLYSNTNYGKSVAAFQVAINAATGNSFDSTECLRNECDPMKVLILDLENDNRTFTDRHSKVFATYDRKLLNENLIIIHDNTKVSAKYGEELLRMIEDLAFIHKPKLIVIDNITKLIPDLLKADVVAKIIDTLRRIKQNTGASFLVIGHTTKNLPTVAITENSYYGSSHIANFFTAIFYIDKVRSSSNQYFFRHAKAKQKVQWIETVPTMELIDNHPKDGLGFRFLGLRKLSEIQMALFNTPTSKRPKPSEHKKMLQIANKGGVSQTELAEIFGVSPQAIQKQLN